MKKKLAMPEQKSEVVKIKLVEYREDVEDNWRSFRAELNHDMKKLGEANGDLETSHIR